MICPDKMSELAMLIPFLLYAEIHYRIGGIFSRYYRRQPEIVFDLPYRIRQGRSLPLALMIKDAHRFPVRLISIELTMIDQDRRLHRHQFKIEETVQESFWHRIIQIPMNAAQAGIMRVNAVLEYIVEGRRHQCVNDNYALTSHKPFTVLIDDHPWPRRSGWFFGETHCHTVYSNDQVEFGAPLQMNQQMAEALELDFIAATDHSYDLDDCVDDYLKNDPALPKWQSLWETIAALNRENHRVLIIPGEELSVGNAQGKNVHLLLYNNRHFWPGYGDSGEKWFQTQPQHGLQQVIEELEPTALAIAAHPDHEPPFLQRWLLRRGKWAAKDFQIKSLNGCQFWNGDKSQFLSSGVRMWSELLLRGLKATLFAGNDAHGNFNRSRQIGTPHWSMREWDDGIFGRARSGVRVSGDLAIESVIAAMRQGRVLCTDGPFADIEWITGENHWLVGDETNQTEGKILIHLESSPTFGCFNRVELITGDISTKKETRRMLALPSGCLNHSETVAVGTLPDSGYLRLEARTRNSDRFSHCFTNPIYLRPKTT